MITIHEVGSPVSQIATKSDRRQLPTSTFVAVAVILLSLSAWTFMSNDKLIACRTATTMQNHDETLGCVTFNATAYERQNWLGGLLALASFGAAGVPLARRMRTRLSEDRDEVVRRLETERQLEVERELETK
jgi:hypothetical protein